MNYQNNISGINGLIDIAKDLDIPWVREQKEHHIALGYLLVLAEQSLLKLKSELNTLHGYDASVRYWQLLLGPWLIQFLSVLYDRYSLLEQVSARSSNLHFELSFNSKLTPKNTYEALKLSETSQFNNQILADIMEFTEDFSFVVLLTEEELCFATTPSFLGTNGLKRQLLNWLSKLATTRTSFVASISAFPLAAQIELIPKLRSLRPIYPYIDGIENYDQKIDSSMRDELNFSGKFETRFEAFVSSILPKYIPVCFLEGFEKLNKLSGRYGRYPNAVLVSTEMYYRYESFMLWVAKGVEQGTKALSMQHGGVYGTEDRSEKTFIEINPYDKFYTWGWEWEQCHRSEKSVVKGMPSLFLYGEIKRRPERRILDKLLFVATSKQQYQRRFDGALSFVYSNELYVNSQMIFCEYLEESIRKKLAIRLYKDDLRNNYKRRLQERFPKVKFDTESNFPKSLNSANLLVVDHIGTTWLEALAFNIPFILYVDGDTYDYNANFFEILQSLKKVSIFHDNAIDAANMVNSIYESVDEWWQDAEVQKVVSDARSLMALSPPNNLEIWLDELKSI